MANREGTKKAGGETAVVDQNGKKGAGKTAIQGADQEHGPDSVRQAALNILGSRLQRLADIADGVTPITQRCPKCRHTPNEADYFPVRPGDQTAAMRVLATIATTKTPEVSPEDAKRLIEALHAVIREQLEPAKAEALITATWARYDDWTRHGTPTGAREIRVVYSRE